MVEYANPDPYLEGDAERVKGIRYTPPVLPDGPVVEYRGKARQGAVRVEMGATSTSSTGKLSAFEVKCFR